MAARVCLDLTTMAAKVAVLELLIRIGQAQDRKRPLRRRFVARYSQGRGDTFKDPRRFEVVGWGDCADATTHAGALLRQRGIKVWPVLQRFKLPGGVVGWHACLWAPGRGCVIDPTFAYFRRFQPHAKGRLIRWPDERTRAFLDRQVAGLRALPEP